MRTLSRTPFMIGALLALAAAPLRAQLWEPQPSGSIADLRGLSVVSGRVAWAGGSRGTVLRTVDGGASWQQLAIPDAADLDFRDVEAFDADRAIVLSIGPGPASRIYGTTDGGRSWSLRFLNADSAAFYDCMAFWGERHGLAVSDPVGGRYRLLATDDGGERWHPLPAETSPSALDGQAAFAASGTCLVAGGERSAWLATGGSAAQVLRSSDRGRRWRAAPTPLAGGAPPKGVFSVAFRTVREGVAVGGNYEAPTDTVGVAAYTTDGGATWRRAVAAPSGYRSGVAVVRGGACDGVLIAVGTSGTDVSADGGRRWARVDSLPLNAVAAGGRGRDVGVWAVGPRGLVARLPDAPATARASRSSRARCPWLPAR